MGGLAGVGGLAGAGGGVGAAQGMGIPAAVMYSARAGWAGLGGRCRFGDSDHRHTELGMRMRAGRVHPSSWQLCRSR
jgi:hypothetical protein